jgi:hypothetical protein
MNLEKIRDMIATRVRAADSRIVGGAVIVLFVLGAVMIFVGLCAF